MQREIIFCSTGYKSFFFNMMSVYERTTVHFRTSAYTFFVLIIRCLLFWHTPCIYIIEGGQLKNEKKFRKLQPFNIDVPSNKQKNKKES